MNNRHVYFSLPRKEGEHVLFNEGPSWATILDEVTGVSYQVPAFGGEVDDDELAHWREIWGRK